MSKQEKKLDELYDLIEDIEIAMFTTRRPDGRLVSRPMATQKPIPDADLWFVTDRETHKLDEIETDPQVNIAYYNGRSREWVSVSGRATISQDRARIRALYQPDWRMWFEDKGGEKNSGPDDPRLTLVLVEVESAVYAKKTASGPVALFELAKGFATGSQPDVLRVEKLSGADVSR